MKRLLAILVVLGCVAVLPTSSAAAKPDGIEWGISNWVAGVQMTTSFPSATDPHVHVRFKRVGGEGQRQVRMGERVKKPNSHQWTPYAFQKAVKLQVGEKVIFTTVNALPCEPAREPLGIRVDLRIKQPGKPWGKWQTWISEDHFLLDCTV